MTMPRMTGASPTSMALMKCKPSPGMAKMLSTTTAPEITAAKAGPM